MPMPRVPMSVMAYSQQQSSYSAQQQSILAMMSPGHGTHSMPQSHSSPVHRPVTPPSLPFVHEPAPQRQDFVSSIAHTMLRAFSLARAQDAAPSIEPVLVGGYAHMAHLQSRSAVMRCVGTWEYGLRDIDLVCVPKSALDTYEDYASECEKFVAWFDTKLNEASQELKRRARAQRWYELTQASSDFSVASRRALQVNSVQKMLKMSEYGCVYLWHMDQHQIANVTILSPRHWCDPIESIDQWLIFPAWRCTRTHSIDRMSRPIVPVRIVTRSYLLDRMAMQLATCALTKDLRKGLFLSVRKNVWENIHDFDKERWQR
jgi:hypothetical protein